MIRNNYAKNTVTLMLVIAVLALFLRLGIEQTIKVNISQNESNASVALKSISTALQNYAEDHGEVFPQALSALIETDPAYLDKDYLHQTSIAGYNFSCSRLDASGYSCSATPIKCNSTGREIYIITTGGVMVSDLCAKKE